MFGAGFDCDPDPNPLDPYGGDNGALSTWMVGLDACHRHLSGTSMAAPHVAGIIGLMRTVNPDLSPMQITQYLTATANAAILSCQGGGCGAGLVDARAAVDAAMFGLGPEIVVVPTSLHFSPPQQVGTSAPLRPITVTNTGTGTLTYTIVGGTATFPLTCGGPCDGSLTQNQTRTVHVGFVPPSHGGHGGAITVHSNDADENPTVVTLSGTGIGPIVEVTPLGVDFGNVPVGTTSPARTVTVRNAASATMALTFSVTPSSSEFPITCAGGCSGTLAAGQSRDVSVTFRPAAAGTRNGALTVGSNDLTRPSVGVSLTGNGTIPQVTVDPPVMSFGQIPIGAAVSRNLTIGNAGAAPLTYDVTLVGDRYTLPCSPCSGTLTQGQTRVIGVTFAPLTGGPHTGTITVASNDPVRPSVTVGLLGTGTTQGIDVTPTLLEFGNVEVSGGTATQSFHVMSVGTAPLFPTVSLSSTDFTLACVSGCASPIPVGQLRTYNVTFDPTVVGLRSGMVGVWSSDPARPFIPVTLGGTGMAPAIAVTPRSLDLGVGVMLEPTAQPLSVQNTGNEPLVLASATVPAGFSVDGTYPITIAPGVTRNLTVTCTRATAGTFSGNLVLAHNAGAARNVPLSCVSLPGRLVFEVPASGNLWVLPGSVEPVRVRNAGPGAVTISAVKFSGDPDSWFTASTPKLPVTLDAGQTLAWTVACTPQAPIPHSEKHSLKHDGFDPGSIALDCDGGPPDEIEPPGFPIDPSPQ